MRILNFYKENLGISLFSTNLILLVIYFLLHDPFFIFSKTYEKAPTLLKIDWNQLDQIQIEFLDKKIQYHLKRTNQKKEKFKDQKEFLENTEWTFSLLKENLQQEYDIDKDNFKNFLEELTNLKKYYYLEKTPENDVLSGIQSSSIKIRIFYNQKLFYTLTLGYASIRNNTTYVNLNNEDKIYQVEGNLKTKIGYDDTNYFRNHIILDIDKQKLVKIIIPNQNLHYSKTGSDWQTLQPKPEKLQTVAFEGILQEISRLKVSKFFDQNLPKETFEKFNVIIELYFTEENQLGELRKEVIEFIGKKDYIKYIFKYKGNYYEASLYRIEDLLQPEKLIEKK